MQSVWAQMGSPSPQGQACCHLASTAHARQQRFDAMGPDPGLCSLSGPASNLTMAATSAGSQSEVTTLVDNSSVPPNLAWRPLGAGRHSDCFLAHVGAEVEQARFSERRGISTRTSGGAIGSMRSPTHGHEQHLPAQALGQSPSSKQCLAAFDAAPDQACRRSFETRRSSGYAWMLCNLPWGFRVRHILDLLGTFGIDKAKATVQMPRRRGANLGYCFVFFFDILDALVFARRAAGHPFPKSTKRLVIRPTSMQDIRFYVMPVQRVGDLVVMAAPGKPDIFVKERL